LYSQIRIESRKELPIKAGEVWSKMIEYIEDEDWQNAKELSEYAEFLVSGNCYYQGNLYHDYYLAVDAKNDELSLQTFSMLIANSIIIELVKISEIDVVEQRQMELRLLCCEVVAIQHILKKYDFELYKQLFMLVRRFNSKIDDTVYLRNQVKSDSLINRILEKCPI
ncbi:hypothetical protein N9R81_05910, partial [Flavobacteriales bacterium]|nr:hypothetical protein [Flavobacteriales bacterium]